MKVIHILLVEDNEGDILLTTAALEEGEIQIELSVVTDGQEAIDFVNKEGKYSNSNLPDLVFLDINLPKKNGFEVLQHIKRNALLNHIPVIMLTTSSSERDINFSYQNGASCFIIKPDTANDLFAVIAAIKNFWISTVKLPTCKAIIAGK